MRLAGFEAEGRISVGLVDQGLLSLDGLPFQTMSAIIAEGCGLTDIAA